MQCVNPEGESYILSLPPKFRKCVYLVRGGYALTEPIPENKEVRGEVVRVLGAKQIKYFNEMGVWPDAFQENNKYLDNSHQHIKESDRGFVHCKSAKEIRDGLRSKKQCHSSADESSDSEDDSDLVPNYNREALSRYVFSDDSDTENDSDSDEDSDSDSDDDDNDSCDEEEISDEEIVPISSE